MEPLTVDDLLLLLGQKEAQILQLQRHIATLTPPTEAPNRAVTPMVAERIGER